MRKVLIVAGVVLLILLIIGVGLSLGDNESTAPAATQPSVEAPAPEDALRTIIVDKLGLSNREGIDKIASIDIVNAGYGFNIDIHYAINDNLSEAWIIDGARMEIRDTMEVLFTSEFDIQWVDMYGSFAMVDSYGQSVEKEVIHARLGRDTAAKVNWENITADMLFDILDFKDIHPAFKK